MELLIELVLTAVISLTFAFFLAKLISLASSADHDQQLTETLISTIDPSHSPVLATVAISQPPVDSIRVFQPQEPQSEEVVSNDQPELRFDAQHTVVTASAAIDGDVVEESEEIANEGVELGKKSLEDIESCAQVVTSVSECDRVVIAESLDERKGDELAEEKLVKEELEREEEVKSGAVDANEAGEEKELESERQLYVGSTGVDDRRLEGDDVTGVVEYTLGERRKEEEVKSLLIEEEDWEGIETSELRKKFGNLVSMLNLEIGDSMLSGLSSDVQMQLYGLHKVATEGPCYEPQPSVLKVSARARWHAWQRLGNMDPELAMEQYINLLSESIPGWSGQKNDDTERKEQANVSLDCGPKAPDSSLSPHHMISAEDERVLEEGHPCKEKTDAILSPKFLVKDIQP